MLDHTSTSHSHEVPSSCCRAVASGAVACAINNPAATAYHHQRNPFNRKLQLGHKQSRERAASILQQPAHSVAPAQFSPKPNRAETPLGAFAIFTTRRAICQCRSIRERAANASCLHRLASAIAQTIAPNRIDRTPPPQATPARTRRRTTPAAARSATPSTVRLPNETTAPPAPACPRS